MEKFSYDPLDLEKPAFRLVRLLKGDEDRLRCELFQASFEEKQSSISYAALSYTWGSMDVTESVEMNGKRLDVTLNLWSAIRDLRLPHQDRILWADGLCINQTNKRERGHQVRQMMNIYRQAEMVIIWLGPATYATNVVINSLRQLHETHRADVSQRRHQTDSDWKTRWADMKHVLKARYVDLEPRMREGLHELLSRPWFGRAWILQEVANAQSAFVYAGHKSVPARFLALAPELIGIRPNSHCEAVLAIMPGPGRDKYLWSQNRQLYTLLTKFRQIKSYYARDTIYALLGISSDAFDNSALHADYEKPEEEIVRNTFRFLYLCETNQCSGETPSTIRGLLDGLTDLNNVALKTHIANSDVCKMETILARSDFHVLGEVLEAAVKEGHPEVIQILLDRRRSQLNLTTSTLRAAWQNRNHAAAMIKTLIKELPETFNLSTELLEAVTKPSCGLTLTDILLQKWNTEENVMEMVLSAASMQVFGATSVMRKLLSLETSKVKVTERVLEAAVKNSTHGEALIRLLLQERGNEVKITEPVLLAAVQSSGQGEALIKLFLQERGNEVRVTEPLLLAAAQNSRKGEALIRLLLQERKNEVKVTEPVLLAAVQSSDQGEALIKLFLQERGNEVRVTEPVLLAAVQNSVQGEALIKLFLQERKNEVKVTEPVLLAAAQNSGQGEALMKMLLKRRRNQVMITEPVLLAAVQNSVQGEALIKLFLQERKNQMMITEPVLLAVAQSTRKRGALIRLLIQEQGEASTNRFVPMRRDVEKERRRSMTDASRRIVLTGRGNRFSADRTSSY